MRSMFLKTLSARLSALLLAGVLLMPAQSKAQLRIQNMAEHDYVPYYFGLTFGLNFSQYRIRYTADFANTDTFKIIQPRFSPGFNLGLMANLRLTKFIDARFIPALSFSDKELNYNEVLSDKIITKNVESIYLHLPLQLKFKSDRLKNFRFYGMVGTKFDYDLSANARSRKTDEYLKVKSIDLGYELGMGFEFYYPNFIFAPEIKLSQGLLNQVFRDRSLPLTNAIDQINTRSIVISIHLQG